MLYHTTWLITKLYPIKFIFEKPSLSGRIARWQVLLSEFDILYVSQKAIKGSAIADFLEERANEEYEPMRFDFPDENLMVVLQIENEEPLEKNGWKMYFDGASNTLGCGGGTVLILPEQEVHRLWIKVFIIGKDVLCIGMDSSKTQTIHALPHYLAYCKIRSH